MSELMDRENWICNRILDLTLAIAEDWEEKGAPADKAYVSEIWELYQEMYHKAKGTEIYDGRVWHR